MGVVRCAVRTYATSNGTTGVSFGCFGTLLLAPFLAVYGFFGMFYYLFKFFYDAFRR